MRSSPYIIRVLPLIWLLFIFLLSTQFHAFLGVLCGEFHRSREMSLVGSEVDVSTSSMDPEAAHPPPFHSANGAGDDDEDNCRRVMDAHPPVSPLRPQEMLFLGDIETQNISATALAEQIRWNYRSPLFGGSTAGSVTEYHSAVSTSLYFNNAQQQPCFSFNTEEDDDDKPFARDPLAEDIAIPPLPEVDDDHSSLDSTKFQDSTMTSEANHVDPATKTYDIAKGVWAWGKGQFFLKPFMGIAEGVAGKVVQVCTGSNLQTVDEKLAEQLHGLDDGLLNPAIATLVKILLATADKTTDVVKPVVMVLLKPLGLIKETAENPELTTSPPALTNRP